MNLHFREYMSAGFESPAALGRRTLTRLGDCMRKALKDRAAMLAGGAGHRFVDIYYDDFVKDGAGTIRALYEQMGLPFEPAFESKIEAKLAADKVARSKKGKSHNYSLDDFGLGEDDIQAEFAEYLALHFGEQ